MDHSFYRRPLPSGTIAFSSQEGRALFAEALAHGGLDGYFQLAEQFHTQSDPAFCGLGSLVVALNALAIDPGRLWKGPWRWFAEDLLDCCVPLAHVRAHGLTLDELACLARCNGAEVDTHHSALADEDLAAFRRALAACARGERVLIASYDRASLGQTGSGHFSPVGGYHAQRDLVLLLDVARFKYPPHWISGEALWRAMHAVDPAVGRARGWLSLSARAHGVALGFTLRCSDASWQALAERIASAHRELGHASDLHALTHAMRPIAEAVELRAPTTPSHAEALTQARAALRALPLYTRLSDAGEEPAFAEVITLLLLASQDRLTPSQRSELGELTMSEPLNDELRNLSAQITAIMTAQSADAP
ncbi:MAG TPA: phytochelatin synthase family protein [Polyangiales bacterium]|nr:phytochelatin synthase family protein [Polyangiales bacterium]